MPGKGRWTLQEKFKRCTGERQCRACQADPKTAPHGPYYELRRRNPDTGHQELIYIGRHPFSAEQLEVINSHFTGPDVPTRTAVESILE